jgi:hypothetical protein
METDVVIMEQLHLEETENQSHQSLYLISRSVEVLYGEGVNRQVLYT